MTSQTLIQISLEHLTHNLNVLRQCIGPNVLIAPCIKANGYGHGIVPVGQHFQAIGADWLTVASIEEGTLLRQNQITIPIQVIGYVPPEQLADLVRYQLTPFIMDLESARALSTISKEANQTTAIVVKVDTGMSRQGFLHSTVLNDIEAIRRLPNVQIISIATHFAAADEEDLAHFQQQLARFQGLKSQLEAQGIQIPIYQSANSAATLRHPQSHFDLVRPGIACYGYYPSSYTSKTVSGDLPRLKPALTLISHISQIKRVPAGSWVSYGTTYQTNRPTTIAVLPIGYSDGLDRGLSNRVRFCVSGRAVAQIGRVCMNHTMIDVTDLSEVELQQPVYLLDLKEITADVHAQICGTINYEIISRLSRDIGRVYVG